MGESKGRVRDGTYYQTFAWMIKRLKLKGVPLQLYSIIYGFSHDGESRFSGGLQYLCEFTGASKQTVIKSLSELVESGYIIKHETYINNVKFCAYSANLEVADKYTETRCENFTCGQENLPGGQKILPGGGQKILPGGGQKILPGGGQKILPNNILSDNLLSDNKNNNKYIVEYLNKKTGKHYKYTSRKTRDLIHARLADGFTVSDFERVIDNKTAEWLGTDMEQYLRPETLFGTKFESYLNQRTPKRKQHSRPDGGHDLDGIL